MSSNNAANAALPLLCDSARVKMCAVAVYDQEDRFLLSVHILHDTTVKHVTVVICPQFLMYTHVNADTLSVEPSRAGEQGNTCRVFQELNDLLRSRQQRKLRGRRQKKMFRASSLLEGEFPQCVCGWQTVKSCATTLLCFSHVYKKIKHVFCRAGHSPVPSLGTPTNEGQYKRCMKILDLVGE